MKKNKDIPQLIITRYPFWNYFQWFLLGFYKLEKEGEIKLSFQTPFFTRLSRIIPNNTRVGKACKLLHQKTEKQSYTLEGYYVLGNQKKRFCIDCADSPFLLDSDLLDKVAVYFKMQCPSAIDYNGFPLTDSLLIPYCDHKNTNPDTGAKTERKLIEGLEQKKHKIKPLMVGPRRLSWSNSFRSLNKAYNNYLKSSRLEQTKKLMCYFGNALGPKAVNSTEIKDFNKESFLMAYFGDKINHPNEKRAKVADIIESLGEGYDARIINRNYADSGKKGHREDLVVPLELFCDHIAQFQYNMNISGYRLSIPNRFIESFMSGTAIVTDRLAVKWYLPFEEEVIETEEMGYLPDNEVNWVQIETDLRSLPPVDKNKVLDAFYRKWSPEKVAHYILNTLRDRE